MMQKKNNLIIYSLMFINLIVFIFPVVSYARTEWQGANCGSVTTVALNSSTPDSITVQKTTNYYGVNVTAPGTLVVYTKGKMNTYGYLRNSSCNKLAEHDNIAKKNKNFRITYDVTTAGMYYIAVENSSKKKTGSYTLYVDFLTDDYGDNCTDSKAVAPTSITAGNIETSGDIDYFKVVIPNVGKLKVYTTGTTDTRGRYYNTSCNQQKEDNNSGSTGLNFQFEQNVTAGTYYYSVEENGNNDTGTYDLHVEFTSTVTWTITSSITGGLGGTISPSGTTVVSGGGSQSYTMTPSDGNTINDVKVDGASQGALSSYSFSGVSADHSIEVTFQVPAHLCADLSDIPLDTKFRAAPANIMFVLDDSGSMDWEFMTDENDGLFWAGSSRHYYLFDNPGDNVYYGTTLSRGTDRKTWKTQWAGYNKLYYNPQVEYVPWPTLSNADPDFPRSHPKIIGNTLNMDGSFDTIDTGAVIIDDNNTSQFLKSPNNEPITIDNEDAEFTIVQEPASSALRIGEYSNQAWESTYRYTNINGQYIVKWTPTLLAGNYDVNVKWHADSNNSTSVTYTIDQGGGITTSTEVDQSTVIDGWVSIATDIPILAGSGEVTLSHNRTSDTERAVADAVQFIPTDASWETASNSDAYDNDYYYTPLVVDTDYPEDGILDEIFPFYAAAWLPDLVGDYTIYARWVGGADRSSAVTYTVKDIGGTIPVTVDQTTNGGTWQQLGAGTFTLNAASYILLTHTQSAADNTVAVADAIKLVPAASSTITINRSHYYIWSDTDNKPYLVVLDGSTSKILYYSVNEQPTGTDGVVEEGELNLLAGDPPDDVKTDRTYTEERQNFANWYSFYRKRELTAAAAISRTIDQMQGVYVGLNTINHRIQQPALGVKAGGVDETTTLLNLLYNLTIKSNGTPLRRGLRDIGRYYDQDDNIKLNGSSGNDSPFASSADGGECQQAFTIAMTDGYYNGSSPYVGNQDAADSENPTFAGSPYADGYSDTLADVAMKYYKEDLCDGLANSIQGNEMDSATHQHMVTYGVSFGVTGNLVSREENPATYDYDFTTPLDPANPVYPTWPNPSSGDQEKIDDLMHASFNGRGLFLSASNPDDLIDSLLTILKDVELRIGSASSVSVNGDELYEEVSTALRIFQSSYDSENWSGNVQSFGVNSLTAEVETNNPFWHARDELQDQDWNTGRMIATYDGSNGITFRYSSLTADMETMLDSNATTAGNILNYVRGDNSNETEEGGAFRDRIYKLGDIVHSSPAYKHGILYVGGNDGMLHAFYSEDDAGNSIEGGEEFFAYVPNLVFENLYKLKDTTYTHQYYVDLTPKVSDVEFTAGGNDITTLLVGGLGKGGKGYFALNISAPDPMDPYKPPSITNETTLAEKVLWEYPNASTPTSTKTITNATNAGPIVITTASAHGFSTGDSIEIANVLGNTAANERWIITSMTATTFSLDGSTGSGAYASGGSAIYTESDSLGYTYSRPNILKSNYNDGDWVVIFGNGYNSPNGHAVLFILDPVDGTLIRKIDTGAANAGSLKCNGLSTPIAIDLNHDSQVDYLYAGDLQGNMWKFDLTSSNPSEWESAYKDTSGTPKPVFQALGPGGLVQPITTRPDVMSMSSANQDGQLILFATGKYIGENDSSDTNIQTIYGIWDYGDDWDDQEYLGSFTRGATPLSNQPATVSLLEQTEIVSVDTYTVGSTTQYDTDYTTAEDTVDDAAGVGNNFNRLNTPVTAVTVDDYKPNPDNHVGWYFDLPITSERVVTDPLVRGGNAIVISYIPNDTPCSASGDSVINEINAVSGARLEETPWDIDENGTIDPPEYDSDGNLTGTGDYLIYDSTAPDSTTAMGTIADRNANETDVYIVAPSRIKKAGRLMSPAIATLPDGDELKIMSSSTANAATQNITTVREAGTTFGIRYWFESQQ
jgi:Tfp pilus tip-associated adhesin PilY1